MRGMNRLSRVVKGITDRSRRSLERLETERRAGGLVPLENENFRYRQMLMPSYQDYVSRVSWADHAVSLRTATVLLQLCETRAPRRLLDTGSGYSSYVLRRYAKDAGAEVVSVDDDAEWMAKTEGFLADYGLAESGRLTMWEDFKREQPEPFDLIFHDMGTGGMRVETLSQVSDLASPTGCIVYDDVQQTGIRSEAKRVTAERHRRLISLVDVTNDEINRYAALSLPAPA